jgi:cytochrome bd-type quinol oxidase subunit 1
LLIFVVRLILGIVFGIFLIRLFRPEWGIYHGVAAGLILVALAYGMAFFKKRTQHKL